MNFRKLTLAILVMAILSMPAASWAAGNEGAELFKSKCVMCHGADASGDTAMGKKAGIKDLRSPEVQKLTDAQITDTITKGKEGKVKMPEYGSKLKPEQIKALVSYIRSIKK